MIVICAGIKYDRNINHMCLYENAIKIGIDKFMVENKGSIFPIIDRVLATHISNMTEIMVTEDGNEIGGEIKNWKIYQVNSSYYIY